MICLTFVYFCRYKFFFAIENSLCKDYISEKFWFKALNNHVVPVVMGPPPRDYELVAPPNSFIHVDDFDSVKSLADYLIKLAANDNLYGEYLKWASMKDNLDSSEKKTEVSDTFYPTMDGKQNQFCEICEKLKKEKTSKQETQIVTNLDQWWFGEGYKSTSDKFSICSPKSGPSGSPKKWLVTIIYNLLVIVILFLCWVTSCCKCIKSKLMKKKNTL